MSLSFLRGMVATVNPCGFILLPTYLMYFLGMQGQMPGTQRATVRRALLVSAALSAGFMSVFIAVGLITYNFTTWINQNAKYATVVIGLALIVLGLAMLRGYKLPISTPRIDAGGRTQGVGSMFVFGIAYAVASIGCTIGLFLPTLFAVRNEGITSSIARVAAYGAGMALLVTALTVALAVANTGLLRVLRGGMQHVETIAAVFVVLSGVYLVYYFWVVDVNESIDPITSRVEGFQLWSLSQLSENWEITAVVLGIVVLAAVTFVLWRRDDSNGAGSETDEAEAADEADEADDLAGPTAEVATSIPAEPPRL
jgi:cytochrome c-type biogenesis protein